MVLALKIKAGYWPQSIIFPPYNARGLKDGSFLELKYLAKLPSIHERAVEEEVLWAEAKESVKIRKWFKRWSAEEFAVDEG